MGMFGRKKASGKIMAHPTEGQKVHKEISDLEVVDVLGDTLDDEDEYDDRSEKLVLQEGRNTLVILPPLKKFNTKLPWVPVGAHFLGDAVEKAIGSDIPADIARAYGCARQIENRSCDWCAQINRLKNSRTLQERSLGNALFASRRWCANAVDLRNPDGSRYPQLFPFGTKIFESLFPMLQSARRHEDAFCYRRGLIPIRIQRKGQKLKTRYTNIKLLSKLPRVVCLDEWLESMSDLRGMQSPIASSTEVRDIMEMLLEGSAIEDIGDDVDDIGETWG